MFDCSLDTLFVLWWTLSCIYPVRFLKMMLLFMLIHRHHRCKSFTILCRFWFTLCWCSYVLWHRWERYIFLYYIPTMLIVITSWTFFLLPSTSYPSRLASTVLNFYRNIMLWLWSFHATEKVVFSQVHISSPNNVVFPLLPSWSKEMLQTVRQVPLNCLLCV